MKSSREEETEPEKIKEREKAKERAGVQGRDEAKEAIDAVITWVDGSDLKHRKKRLQAMKQDTDEIGQVLQSRSDETRFLDNGELRFCIASIRRFAPWIRNIYLVTDNQRPGFLTDEICAENNVSIVDHSQIFDSYEWVLPTFNSRSIETALWRIPGLADKFIYFNDDFVITAPVEPNDFFIGEKVVMRGAWYPVITYGRFRLLVNRFVSYLSKKMLGVTRSMHLLLQIRSAELAGFGNRYYRIDHVPHPVHRPVLEKYFEENPDHFEQNIRFKFRDIAQFSSIFLAYHLKIARKEAVFCKTDDVLMIHGEMDPSFLLGRKIQKIGQQDVRFISLQGIEKMNDRYREKLEKVLVDLTGMSL